MQTRLLKDDWVIETLHALWRKCDVAGARALLVRIPDPMTRELWRLRLDWTKAELNNNVEDIVLPAEWAGLEQSEEIPTHTWISMQLVRGNIAILKRAFQEAEDIFFKTLLQSREVDFPEGKVYSLLGLGRIKTKNNQFEQAMDLIVTAESLVEKIEGDNQKFAQAEVLWMKGDVALNTQDYDTLSDNARRLLDLSVECGDTLKHIHALNHIAIAYGAKGDFKHAMPFFLEALDACQQISYSNLAAKIETNIATIHGQLHNYKEALSRYLAILNKYKTPISDVRKTSIYNNIGLLHIKLKRWRKAISYFVEAEIIADKVDHVPFKRLAFCQIARCLVETKSYDALLTHLKSGENWLKKSKSFNGSQILRYVKAKYALAKNDYKQAITHARAAARLAASYKDDATALIAMNILAEAYEKIGDIAAALKVFKKYTRKKEKLDKEIAGDKIIHTEIQYILKAKEREIQTLQETNQLQAELIKSSSLIRNKEKELLAKHEEMASFARMISLSLDRHVRTIKEYLPFLSGANLSPAGKAKHLSVIDKAATGLQDIVAGLQRFSAQPPLDAEARPVPAEDIIRLCIKDLEKEIESARATIRLNGPFHVVHCVSDHLIFVIKELIRNAIRFSGDRPPEIEIRARVNKAGKVVLEIEDQGVGVGPEDKNRIFEPFYGTGRLAAKEGPGLGLSVCKRLIENNGGTISVLSQQEATVFRVVLPASPQ